MARLTIAKNEGQQQAAQTSTEVLAQINNFGGPGGLPNQRNAPAGGGFGPGGVGQGAQPVQVRQPGRSVNELRMSSRGSDAAVK